jgi:hypothetical protein
MKKKFFAFLMLLFLMSTVALHAESFVKKSSSYSCMVAGKNIVQFKLPTFEYYSVLTNVHVVADSYVEATVDGKTKRIIEWKHPGSDANNPTYMRTLAPGQLTVLMTRYGKSNINITSNDDWKQFELGNDDDDKTHYSATVNWAVPYEWQGKRISFKLHVKWEDISSGTVDKNFDPYDSPAPPDISLNLMEPMLAYDKTHIGEIMIPYYIQANKCTKLTLQYKDAISNEQKELSVQPLLSSNVYVPMNRPLKEVRLVGDLIDTDGNKLAGRMSDTISINMFHQPSNFTTTMLDDATVKLTWKVDNASLNDIVENDFWEIQRNVTGATDDEDVNWKSISQIEYIGGKTDYEFIDDDLMPYYQGKDVVYRIRRMASGFWGWSTIAGRLMAVSADLIRLPLFGDATVRKETWTDDDHTVTIKWNEADVEPYIDNPDINIGSVVDESGIFYPTKEVADEAQVNIKGFVASLNPFVVVSNKWLVTEGNNDFWPTGSLTYDITGYKPYWTKTLYEQQEFNSSNWIAGLKIIKPNYKMWSQVFQANGGDAYDGKESPVMNTHVNPGSFFTMLRNISGKEYDNVYVENNDLEFTFFDVKGSCYTYSRQWARSKTDKNVLTFYPVSYAINNILPTIPDNYSAILYTSSLKTHRVWDKKAKLLLYVHSITNNGKYTQVVDISNDENAVKNHIYTYALERKCVDYEFELVIKRGNSALCIDGTMRNEDNQYPDSVSIPVSKIETGEGANYSFVRTDTILTFNAEEKQNSVRLEWTTKGGEHDYFRLWKRNQANGSSAEWEEVATDLAQTFYEDTKVKPQTVYEYKVESVFQCEGLLVHSKTCTGHCTPTGMVRGYLRLPDGTGLGGYTVKAVPVDGKAPKNAETKTCVTNNDGFFEIGGLVYQGQGSYDIQVETTGSEFSLESVRVDFDTNTNLKTNVIFYVDTYYIYSGNVYYEDSSIPVQGVEFKMDGKTITDANGVAITTNTQGAFELSIPKGEHQVQAVKEGHVFENEGFLLVPNAKEGKERDWNWKENKSEVFLWDKSLVTLQGRVIGGNDQGNLPLGKSLSVNNLGDSIKIVMQLEGDNTSWIVRDQKDPTVTTRTDYYSFGKEDKDTTMVYNTRHTITIYPDNQTGEFMIKLHPAKYKVIDISAQGYATLFQEGKVGETLDLSFKENGDTAVYNRIYHVAPTLDIVQFNPKNENYFGVKQCLAQDNVGNKDTVTVWNAEDGTYSFGHPVFMAGSPYGWMMQACEKYYYNNNPHSEVDIVKLDTGEVHIRNGLISDQSIEKVQLDKTGGGSYLFTPQNSSFMFDNDMALKTVGITLQYDSTYYDVKPFNGQTLKGYVMVTQPKNDGNIIASAGTPHLFDILRDPPGSGSSAYIEAGSKLSYSYNMSFDASLGLRFASETSVKQSYYTGTVVVPSFGATGVEYGTIDGASKKNTFSLDIISKFGINWTCSYNIDVTERVQTSTNKKFIGPQSDLFIGANENVILQDAVAVRVIPERQYLLMKNHEGGEFQTTDGHTVKVKNGTMKKLAEGTDFKGNKVYLVRDEVLGVSTKVQSTFVHSQYYIVNELIPNLMKLRNSMILPKDSVNYAQVLADKKGIAVYVSKVDKDDKNFGVEYQKIDPKGISCTDSVDAINRQVTAWIGFLVKNEEEKLSVRPSDLVKNYDVDGLTSVQYSENFSTTDSYTRYIKWPIIGDAGLGIGTLEGLIGKQVQGILSKVVNEGKETQYETELLNWEDQGGLVVTKVGSPGSEVVVKFLPVLNFQFNDKNSMSSSLNKKIGFTLSLSTKSNMNIDVYRTRSNINDMDTTVNMADHDAFYNLTVKNLEQIRIGGGINPASYVELTSTPVYSSFVYRTRGGVTNKPYEDERRTEWYNPGTLIDAKTKSIDNLKIWTDQPVVSNVPFDEPARFTLFLSNDTDRPKQATTLFTYELDDASNKNGAKLFVDGAPVTGNGTTVFIDAGQVVTKQLELYPDAAFDYENIGLYLFDPDDLAQIRKTYISAHFVPTAGKIRISMPSNNWVINTESSYDGKQQLNYMPVRIDGFNVNERNFDHIELQYKLSTQGDKDWVNVCSYYNDRELLAKASGQCDTIPANGAIIAKFYGEKDPVEQYYDIRAVVFCRHANGFITSSSDILSGVKDTRRPEVFGTPEPIDGILDIGENIVITFSEPIAGNYLSKANNFEVLGTPVSNDISLSTSLSFNELSFGRSQAECNLAEKDFTIDLMINPANNGKQMAVISHGGYQNGMLLGLTADNKLAAQINGIVLVSDQPVNFNGLHRVAYAVKQNRDTLNLKFYDGGKLIGEKYIKGTYQENGYLSLGLFSEFNNIWNPYEGDILDLRVWNRCLSESEIGGFAQKVLTGYEQGLISYYMLNEGNGETGYDKGANGNDLNLFLHTWKVPNGISLKIDGTEGVLLKPEVFKRDEHEDYTLMFWFRMDEQTGTLMSNGPAMDEANADQHFNIFVNDQLNLCFRSNGMERTLAFVPYIQSWHHYAMTVQRSRNVANFYLDKKLVTSIPADSIGGIGGNMLALGATYDENMSCKDVMNGHIDQVAMFASALPLSLIETYYNQVPVGTEKALLAYLGFSTSEKQDDNSQLLVPTGVSLKRYIDNQGKIIETKIDTLIDFNVVSAKADRNTYALMTQSSKLDNVKYSYVVDGNKLLINLDVPDTQIEKTNVYVTVHDVADLNGNLMESPLTMDVFVYRNPLRWLYPSLSYEVLYGQGTEFCAVIKNLSGKKQTFEIKDLPVWISASMTEGVINPLEEQEIRFEVSPFINIGNYKELITLQGGNGMTENLTLNIKVRTNDPNWMVSEQLKNENQVMQMVAQVKIDGVIATDKNDMLAVFGDNQEVLGVAHIDVDNKANAYEALAYIMIYAHPNSKTQLSFKFYDASTGKIYVVEPKDKNIYTFKRNETVGSVKNPVVLENVFNEVATLQLKHGWNWVSFNIAPMAETTIGKLLYGAADWEPGDQIEIVNGKVAMQFYCVEDNSTRGYRWTEENKVVTINPRIMYRIYSMSPKDVYIGGEDCSYMNVIAKKGWNRLAYLSTINLPISQAMSKYLPYANENDVLKSQDAFAVLTDDGTGNLIWKGTLRFLEMRKGYMLKRNSDKEVEFSYPHYWGDNRYSGTSQAPARRNINATSMNIVANVDGVDLEANDTLMVYNGIECCGVAVADDEGTFYLNVGVDEDLAQNLTFTIQRGGDVVAVNRSRIPYKPDNVLGTPDNPTVIDFASVDEMADDGGWYTVTGIKLNEKPVEKGMYINNGKVIFIK